MSIAEISSQPKMDLQFACEICDHNLDLLMNNHGRCGVNNAKYMQVKIPADCPDFDFRKNDSMEDEIIDDFYPEKDCPICGNEAIWDDFEHTYICTNDECQNKFK